MISKTKISKRIKIKRNPDLVETIELAKKNNLLELAKELSKPKRLKKIVNLSDLNKLKEKKILVPGKVLSSGYIDKKITIAALEFSETALEKLKKAGCEIKTIKHEIKAHKKLEGYKII